MGLRFLAEKSTSKFCGSKFGNLRFNWEGEKKPQIDE